MQKNLYFVTARSLTLILPQGENLFTNLSFSISSGKIGLVGPNGIGKSTLARILAGSCEATSGDLRIQGKVVYFPQERARPQKSVAEFLAPFWESPMVASSIWQSLILDLPLEQPLGTLSGGEWTRVRLLETLAQEASLLILDEPSNNLDRQGKMMILKFVQSYAGSMLLISHDRELLNETSEIWELSNQGLDVYGGNYNQYLELKKAERKRLEEKISTARRELKKTEREAQEKLQTQDKRMRRGALSAEKGGLPKILLGARKRKAQETRGQINKLSDIQTVQAKREFKDLLAGQKNNLDFDLPLDNSSVPEGKRVFEVQKLNFQFLDGSKLWEKDLSLCMMGPKRWAILGPNGSGKSSFLKALLDGKLETSTLLGAISRSELPVAYLDQSYDVLDFSETVFNNVLSTSRKDPVELRNLLARLQFTSNKVHQLVSTLSGGEKLKAALAKILLATPSPQFLVLDEPTNNLDLESLLVLESALNQFQGALLLVTHDRQFLENIRVTDFIELPGKWSR